MSPRTLKRKIRLSALLAVALSHSLMSSLVILSFDQECLAVDKNTEVIKALTTRIHLLLHDCASKILLGRHVLFE